MKPTYTEAEVKQIVYALAESFCVLYEKSSYFDGKIDLLWNTGDKINEFFEEMPEVTLIALAEAICNSKVIAECETGTLLNLQHYTRTHREAHHTNYAENSILLCFPLWYKVYINYRTGERKYFKQWMR